MQSGLGDECQGGTWQLKSHSLQLKQAFQFCSCSWGIQLCLVLPFWAHLEILSANLIQYVHCKAINQGRLALRRKTLLGSAGSQVCKWLFLLLPQKKRFVNVLCISPFPVGPHIGRYCGQKTPGRIHSSSGILSMVFYTDSAIAKEGFSANYSVLQSSVSEGQCLFILQSLCSFSSHTCGHMEHWRNVLWIGVPNVYFSLLNEFCEYHYKELSDVLS